ncbi:putative oxidoreductase [Smittium mucronatum]|uniref:Putative oxidoreductase n=1 Tax=Smittium mucronatum TaxID=133383 RepID=A0A1R0H424_9FUNG|nr:putative oxidoreductase [Smittium mucronatum]
MFDRLQGKVTCITGASSGFGEAAAILFAKHGSNLILTARREDRLKKVSEVISAEYPTVKVHIIKMDVSDHELVIESFKKLPSWAKDIDILVNNAGQSYGLDLVKDVPESTIDLVFNTNVKGLIFVSQQVLPSMLERNSGHIINVGSIAGQTAYPNGSIYCASKFAVHAISDSLRIETNSTKIRVSEINPGMAETEFSLVRFDGDEERAGNVYKGIEPMTADDIAEIIAFTASTHPRCVVSNVTALANGQANPFIVHRDL